MDLYIKLEGIYLHIIHIAKIKTNLNFKCIKMPGENCCVVNCSVSRNNKGVGLFKLPSKRLYPEWRSEWLQIITKYRTVDKNFKGQIEDDKVHICEKHFSPDDIETFESGRKKPRPSCVPRLNFPQKSLTEKQSAPRKEPTQRNVVKKQIVVSQYKNLEAVIKNALNLKSLHCWTKEIVSSQIRLIKTVVPYTTPKYIIEIDDSLGYTVQIFEWFLPEDHWIYKDHKRSLKNVSVADLIKSIESLKICEATSDSSNHGGNVRYHVLRKNLDTFSMMEELPLNPYQHDVYHRVEKCIVLIEGGKASCQECLAYQKKVNNKVCIKSKNLNKPAKKFAPLTKTHPNKVKLALQNERLKCSQLESELIKMRKELEQNTINIDHTLSNDFTDILSNADSKMTPFLNLFWQQQKKLFTRSPKGSRYHPMIIRFCLSIASKSKSAYEELRNTNILRLPSTRTLVDYKNAINPEIGFQLDILESLCDMTKDYSHVERYVVLLFDEMKVRSNLVFDKHTEELIGFVDLGDPIINFNAIEEESKLASYVLCFYLRGICTNLKFSLAHFATDGMTATQAFPIFWEAVSLLQYKCNLWVIAATADGAGPNRKLFRMLGGELNRETIVYKTKNLAAPQRSIYFFSDPPHLIKTCRNCLSSSGSHTRFMWNNDKNLVWQHIVNLFHEDLDNGLKLLPKLTQDHINLTSYSKMNVKLAAQVLSKSVAAVLIEFGPPDAVETAKFCEMIDSFFDCLNVRSLEEGKEKRKPFLSPYRSTDDPRFDWLMQNLLPYFQQWKANIEKRQGVFSDIEKAKMFLSLETYEGIQISTYSMVECVKFLLGEGMQYVLTERFCQDPVEEYFGHQRMLGRRSENPDIRQYLYNGNTIRVQKEVSLTSGNTRGRYDRKRAWESVSNSKLKKRKRNYKTTVLKKNISKVNFTL